MQPGEVLRKGQGAFVKEQVAARKKEALDVVVEEEVLGRRTEVAVVVLEAEAAVVLEAEAADRCVVGTVVTVHSIVATERHS